MESKPAVHSSQDEPRRHGGHQLGAGVAAYEQSDRLPRLGSGWIERTPAEDEHAVETLALEGADDGARRCSTPGAPTTK